MSTIYRALNATIERISQLAATRPVQLVAVSKTKPVSDVMEAYNAGQRHFGENYVQEIVEKAPQLPADIRWHFIGHLQANKVKSLVKIPNLYMVQGIDSEKIARVLNKACEGRETKLKVLIQVNTSGEESKSGCSPTVAVPLFRYVQSDCLNLNPVGLMTIGSAAHASDPSCFQLLVDVRQQLLQMYHTMDPSAFELSMGMSGDYPLAIANGSTIVRIGSSIFGAREYANSTAPDTTSVKQPEAGPLPPNLGALP